MNIEIQTGIFYDTEKPYSDQEPETQQAVESLIIKKPDHTTEEPAGHYPRPLKQIWDYAEFVIGKIYTYQHPADHPENGIGTENITVEKGEPWHETGEQINYRMFQLFADNRRMLRQIPEFAMYAKSLEVYESNTGIYMYFGFFEEGHRELLQSFNAIITERE